MGDLLKFFLLAYAATWACFITVAKAVPLETPLGYSLVLLGAYSPSLVSIALTAWRGKERGVRALLRPVLRWEVAGRYYVFAAGYMVAIKLAVALILRVSTGAWPRFGTTALYLIPLAVAFSTPFQAGEEIGWRGYALPRMAARLGLRWASLVLGVVWALWHLPQFFIRGGETYGQSFYIFSVQVVAISVALAWLWAKTGRSLLLPMLLHSAVNNSKDIVPSATAGATHPFTFRGSPVAWVTLLLMWGVAACLLARMPGRSAASQDG